MVATERRSLSARFGTFSTQALSNLTTRLASDLHVGGASSSRASGHVPFNQVEALQQASEQRAACVPFSAAWLDQTSNSSRNARGRMEFLSRADTVSRISDLQSSYRTRELAIRSRSSQFSEWFQPTFSEFGITLGNDRVLDVISEEDRTMRELASSLSERGSSHIMVIRRTNGDDHAIAAHQSGNSVRIFDPNHGEYKFRRSELSDGLRSVIQAYSSRVPVPEVRLIRASS